MESGVVQLMVEHVCIAMATHGQEARVVLWAAKAFANASSNGEKMIVQRCPCSVWQMSIYVPLIRAL